MDEQRQGEESNDGWFLSVDGSVEGPLRLGDLLDQLRVGKVRPEDRVWHPMLGQWHSIGDILSLAGDSATAAPLPQPATRPAPERDRSALADAQDALPPDAMSGRGEEKLRDALQEPAGPNPQGNIKERRQEPAPQPLLPPVTRPKVPVAPANDPDRPVAPLNQVQIPAASPMPDLPADSEAGADWDLPAAPVQRPAPATTPVENARYRLIHEKLHYINELTIRNAVSMAVSAVGATICLFLSILFFAEAEGVALMTMLLTIFLGYWAHLEYSGIRIMQGHIAYPARVRLGPVAVPYRMQSLSLAGVRICNERAAGFALFSFDLAAGGRNYTLWFESMTSREIAILMLAQKDTISHDY